MDERELRDRIEVMTSEAIDASPHKAAIELLSVANAYCQGDQYGDAIRALKREAFAAAGNAEKLFPLIAKLNSLHARRRGE